MSDFKPKILKPPVTSSFLDKDNASSVESTDFVYNRHLSHSIQSQRQRLPIFNNCNHILYLLEKYRTLVPVGETGCGKSTQIPQKPKRGKISAWAKRRANNVIRSPTPSPPPPIPASPSPPPSFLASPSPTIPAPPTPSPTPPPPPPPPRSPPPPRRTRGRRGGHHGSHVRNAQNILHNCRNIHFHY